MSIPLDRLIDSGDNVYTSTCAMIKRAEQIAVFNSMEEESEREVRDKPVSQAIGQVLEKEVDYRMQE